MNAKLRVVDEIDFNIYISKLSIYIAINHESNQPSNVRYNCSSLPALVARQHPVLVSNW